MSWITNLFKPKGRIIPTNQAGGPYTATPNPRLDDYGSDGAYTNAQPFMLDGPTPAQIEWMFGVSDELARTVLRLRSEVWRRGVKVEPLHPKFCNSCGSGIDEDKEDCPTCGATNTGENPDPEEKKKLEDFMKDANKTFREDLVEVGERKTEETLKHGRGYIVFKMDYFLKPDDGTVDESVVKGVFAASSARVIPLRRKDGNPGGLFICLKCRATDGYKPEAHPGKCPSCDYVLYEAWYGQMQSVMGGPIERYWLPEEVHETRWPYKDGSGPIRRLWPKVSTLLMMDWYAAWALDPKRDKRPDKILVTMGGDEASIKAWAKADNEMRKKNPYKMAHLHIPTAAGGLNENKAAVEVVDLGESEFKGQMLELRQEFEAAVRKHYGLGALQAGDTDEKGGLGTSTTPQMDSTAQVAESIQVGEEKWLLRLAQKLGAKQWTYKFPPVLEENDGNEADTTGKWLDVATKAAGAGLVVEWRAGKPHISDGEIKPPAPPMLPGMEGLGDSEGGEDVDAELPSVGGVPVTQFPI